MLVIFLSGLITGIFLTETNKMEEKKETPKYTMILHKPRIELDLSCNEYCLADIIYHLSNNPTSKITGWCYASKEQLGSYLGISKQTAHNILNRLLKSNLVEKDENTKWLRTSSLWYDSVVIEKIRATKQESKETLPIVKQGVKKVYSNESNKFTPNGKESLHNSNIDNNIDKDNIILTCEQEVRNSEKELLNLFYRVLNPNIKFNNKTLRGDAKWLVDNYPFEKLEAMVLYIKEHQGEQYFPSINNPSQLRDKMAQVINHKNREKTSSKIIKI